MEEKIKELSEKIIRLLEEKKTQKIKEIINDLYPTEFAEVTDYLPIEQTLIILLNITEDMDQMGHFNHTDPLLMIKMKMCNY